MKGIVVDDESIAHKIISDYCKKSDDIQVVGCFQNPIQAITFLNNNSVDLIFLDINMPELNGIEFSKALIHPYKIIVQQHTKISHLKALILALLIIY